MADKRGKSDDSETSGEKSTADSSVSVEDPAKDDSTRESDVRELRQRLDEKERLVRALTDRLEQAAEQLDRVRRTGGRGERTSVSAIPAELVEGQRELLDELQEAIGAWRELQGSTTLGQLGMQIAELRELVAGRVIDARSPNTTGMFDDFEDTAEVHETLDAEPVSARIPVADTPADPLLEEDGDFEIGEEPESPPTFEFDEADLETAIEAIQLRDEYIGWLIRKLRGERARRDGPLALEALADAPDELRARIEKRANRLEESLRLAEVEFSMERARLAREESRLNIREEQLHKLAQRYETEASGDDGGDDDDFIDAEAPRGSRWLQLLGLKRDLDDEM